MKTWLLGMLLAAPAMAQEAPRVLPDRDVTIVYRLSGAAESIIPGGAVATVRVAWDAKSQRLRAEPAGQPQALLVDLPAHSVKLVDAGLHTAMTLPVRDRDLEPLTLEGAHLTRRGTATVAGLSCTEYAVQSHRGHGTVCLTPEGVALRAAGEVDGRQGSLTADSVSFDPVPEAQFRVPPGYMQLALPRMDRNR